MVRYPDGRKGSLSYRMRHTRLLLSKTDVIETSSPTPFVDIEERRASSSLSWSYTSSKYLVSDAAYLLMSSGSGLLLQSLSWWALSESNPTYLLSRYANPAEGNFNALAARPVSKRFTT